MQAPDLEILESHIAELDESSLVVFDVDDTLIAANDSIFSPKGEVFFQKFLSKIQSMEHAGEELASKVLLSVQFSLVDPKVINLIQSLKSKKIRTIALTAMQTGPYGACASLEQWRVDQLAALGIDFSWSFPDIESHTFHEFDGNDCLPVFKCGVLASSKYPKGEVLCSFLRLKNFRPSKVLFIDDKLEYIHSVEQELAKEKIDHVSFHYTAAADNSPEFDPLIAKYQLEHLISHQEWLSDVVVKNKAMGLR